MRQGPGDGAVTARAETTLGESLRARRAGRFVGRAAELESMRRWLGPDGDATPILNLTGAGGMGKSWLLARFAEQASAAGRHVIMVDGRQIGGDPGTFYSLASGTADPREAARRLQLDGLLLIIDTFGALEALSGHVVQLVESLPATARVLIACRDPLSGTWTSWSGSIRQLLLRGLSLAEQYEYLARRGVTDRVDRAYLAGLSGGHPLTLSLAADLVETGGDPVRAREWSDVVAALATELRAGLPPASRAVIEAAAFLGRFGEEDLAAITGRPDAAVALGELSGLSLLRVSGDRFEIHDEIRRAVIEDLRVNRPARLAELRRRALKHYRSMARLGSPTDRSLVLERIRMVGRDMFELSAWYGSEVESDVIVEEATPAALADLVRLQAHGFGPGMFPPPEELSPQLIADLLSCPQASVRVARGATGGRILGYGFWLELTGRTVELFPPGGAVTAAVERALRALGRDRLPDGHSHLYYLSAVAIDGDQPAAHQSLGLDMLPLFSTEGAYLSLTCDPVYSQGLLGVGSRPLGDPLPGGPGRPGLQPYLLDVSTTGFEGWIQALATGAEPVRLPDGEALVELVGRAAAAWADDQALAGTVLADVAEGDPDGPVPERADAARQLLLRSVGADRPWPTPEARIGEALARAGVTSLDPAGPPPGPVEAAAARAEVVTTLRLLGGCEVVTPDGRVLGPPSGVAGHALRFIALKGKVPVDELVEQLWPDAPPGAGRNRLRTVLTRLRQAVGSVVTRSGDWVSLASDVVVDTDLFTEAAATACAAASAGDARAAQAAGRALALYRGELLPDARHLSFTAGPRERLRGRFVAVVLVAMEAAAASGDVDAAVALVEDTIGAHPHDETLYLTAATLLARAGRPADAARFLRRGATALAELGLPLSVEADRLAASLAG